MKKEKIKYLNYKMEIVDVVEEVNSATTNCHNLLYIINKIEEYKDYLSKEDIINILNYYYLFNKDIFDNIL